MRLAKSEDLADYTKLLQSVYENAYTNPSIGLAKECFSMQVFTTPGTQEYLLSNLRVDNKQLTWLAFDGSLLVGSITIAEKGSLCELRGFYVETSRQGKGIGKMLFTKILEFTGDRDIVLDIYAHNRKTIEMYKRWGFVEDNSKPPFYRHWPEWPEGVQAKSIYMRLSRNT